MVLYGGQETSFAAALADFAAPRAAPDPRTALFIQEGSLVLAEGGRIVEVRAGHVAIIQSPGRDENGDAGLRVFQYGVGEPPFPEPGLPDPRG